MPFDIDPLEPEPLPECTTAWKQAALAGRYRTPHESVLFAAVVSEVLRAPTFVVGLHHSPEGETAVGWAAIPWIADTLVDVDGVRRGDVPVTQYALVRVDLGDACRRGWLTPPDDRTVATVLRTAAALPQLPILMRQAAWRAAQVFPPPDARD